MALRRPGVRIPLGPQESVGKLFTHGPGSDGSARENLIATLTRSSRPSASEPGERGVSPVWCQRNPQVELAWCVIASGPGELQ